ncbi:MAG: TlpA disulfide reductase family protein [Balneolales bacterium]
MAFTIHPKYFNKFIAFTGLLCLIAVAWTTILYVDNQQDRFEERLGDGSAVRNLAFPGIASGDSIRISAYRGSPVILDFWATWARQSSRAHRKLAELQQEHPGLVVIAASVKDSDKYVGEYLSDHDYDFIYADGTQAYQDLLVPGVPTQLVFDSKGVLQQIFVGFKDENQFDSILNDR